MPPLVPARFLVRISHPCPHVSGIPRTTGDKLLALPAECGLESFAALDDSPTFADVRIGWTDFGLGFECTVNGKNQPAQGDIDRPRTSDGVTFWIDTRDARSSHRASRYCLQFHLLPSGGGPDKEAAAFLQTKINRAQQDAPICAAGDVSFRATKLKAGYKVEVFLPAAVLAGWDPEQHPVLGIYYHVRDGELGDQFLGVNGEFPVGDDPSLWEPLELVRDAAVAARR